MNMTFGAKIKNARTLKGLTQKQLAEKIGAKHNSISDWEKDKNKPDPDTIEFLCGVLDITPNYLLGNKTNNEISPAETNIIKKIRSLDDYGRETVLLVLDREFTRSAEQLEPSNNPSDSHTTIQIAEFQDKEIEPEEVITPQAEPPDEETSPRPVLRAAHRNEATYTEEGAQADYAKMAELKKKYLKK